MLVLERKVQEGFWIDQRIYVKVIGIGKRRVKLGIEAPLELKVTRSELGPLPSQTSRDGLGSNTVQVLPERRRQ